jgi:CRP/FNR family transcriptional regulator
MRWRWTPCTCAASRSPIEPAGHAHAGAAGRLFSLLSAEIGKVATLAANHRTEERMAAFLLDIPSATRGAVFPPRFNLTMARTEIANYLRMAPETAACCAA